MAGQVTTGSIIDAVHEQLQSINAVFQVLFGPENFALLNEVKFDCTVDFLFVWVTKVPLR